MASAAAVISKLEAADDLILEILIRLPDPQSAARCKPVCKRWNSLISAPYFSRCFFSHHQTTTLSEVEEPPPLLLNPSDFQEWICSFVPMPSDEIRSRCVVFDCFRDLLLLGFRYWETCDPSDEFDTTYFVCNPFTEQWVFLPLAPQRSRLGYSTTKLVCEPCRSVALDCGKENPIFITHRFRVVRLYGNMLDVFSSESGEWMVKVLDHSRRRMVPTVGVDNVAVSHNGKVYWTALRGDVIECNPFRPQDDPAFIMEAPEPRSSIWTSQGALHMISRHVDVLGDSMEALTVWRWEEENPSRGWREQYRVLLSELTLGFVDDDDDGIYHEIRGSEFHQLRVVGHHPEKSEIVFLFCELSRHYSDYVGSAVLSCNLRSGELEFFADEKWNGIFCLIFQPRVTLWPTSIPSYAKLRSAYDGSYSCWLQANNQLTS